MKEYPILFSDPMVRAILSGQKTQTRRVVNPYPPAERSILPYLPSVIVDQQDGTFAAYTDGRKAKEFRCPYGQPGDRLWVREAWAPLPMQHQTRHPAIYRASGEYQPDNGRWRPSIHMPRWACRLVPEIVSVRVERLQDISEADARAEGVDDRMILNAVQQTPNPLPPSPYVGGFRWLWESINGAESWAANPWVWVVEFRRVQP